MSETTETDAPLHDLVRRYIELAPTLGQIPFGSPRMVAVNGQLSRLAVAIGRRAGSNMVLVAGDLALVPIEAGEAGPSRYRVDGVRDMDVESLADYQMDLIASTRALIRFGHLGRADAMFFAAELRIVTGATADEADQVVRQFASLSPEEVPDDLAGWKITAARFLESARLQFAIVLPDEEF